MSQASPVGPSLYQLVEHHLKETHFLRVDLAWVGVAIQAIKAVEADPEGDYGWDDLEVPTSQIKSLKTHVSVNEIMDGLNLWNLVKRGRNT